MMIHLTSTSDDPSKIPYATRGHLRLVPTFSKDWKLFQCWIIILAANEFQLQNKMVTQLFFITTGYCTYVLKNILNRALR